MEVLDLLHSASAAERNEHRCVEDRAALEDFGSDRRDALGRWLGGKHLFGKPLHQAPVGEDLERRPRLPPARRDYVVLHLLEIDIAHLG